MEARRFRNGVKDGFAGQLTSLGNIEAHFGNMYLNGR
jgi:hypothetical protein